MGGYLDGASANVARIDAMMKAMSRSGQLQEFNRAYKIRRAAAIARGEGFMVYGVALKRLKAALVPHLMQQSAGPMRSLFKIGDRLPRFTSRA